MKALLVPGRLTWILALICASFGAALAAQQIPGHMPDGGTHETVQSIDIPAIPNSPFSAIIVTEWAHILPDGSKQTVWNHRLVARDSSGRVFQERRYFSPTGQTQTTLISELDYVDPNQHQLLLCMPNRTCRAYPYTVRFVPPPPEATLPPLTKLLNGIIIQRQDLGQKSMEDVDTLGSREITTIPVGAIGNEKPQPIVKEFWYAPHLGINVVTKRFDPRVSSIQNFTVTQINLDEPDPKLFEPPGDYRIERMGQQ